MNIFVLDTDVNRAARYHNDKHVVKMILEYAQMLSTAVRKSGIDAGYKPTHVNHPCTVWARQSLSNWRWLRDLAAAVNAEYRYRYDKDCNHKSYDMIQTLPEPLIDDVGILPFPQAMPQGYKRSCAVKAYRGYYMGEKRHIASWKKRNAPKWFNTNDLHSN